MANGHALKAKKSEGKNHMKNEAINKFSSCEIEYRKVSKYTVTNLQLQ